MKSLGILEGDFPGLESHGK